MLIESKSNPKVKLLRELCGKKGRSEHSLYLAEGFNVLKDADITEIKEFYVKKSAYEKFSDFINVAAKPYYILSDAVFDCVSDTENSNGLIAVLGFKKEKPLSCDTVLVLDSVRDAGNMGAIVRTAAAMGVYDIITVNCVDIYNPKTVRAAMGGIFLVNVVDLNYEKLSAFLLNYSIIGLDMKGGSIYGFRPEGKTALVLGGEARGISENARKLITEYLSVPMTGGKIESLNAAVAAGICISFIANARKN